MSKYFSYNAYTGEMEDIVWKRAKGEGSPVWQLYLGPDYIGHISRGRGGGYTAIIMRVDNSDLLGPRLMGGFRTRWAATEYILKVGGYRGDQDSMGQSRTRMEYSTLEMIRRELELENEHLRSQVESLEQAAMRQQAEDFPFAFDVDRESGLDTIETPSGHEVRLRRLTFPETQRIVSMFRADDVAAIAEYVTTKALRPY